jgi:hypothetical protein
MNDKANNQVVVRGGVGLSELLGVAFIVLKLMGVINWSWWLVTIPLWGPIALIIAVVIVTFAVAFIVDLFNIIFRR